ncbi:hypothetical protein T02_16271 [Trichinella nativa]|uniref:Uncharacterized protein n=1 Tax=Trichinella nativa TaxID=6335 RepID=A0A0V1LCH6_9BILA|nr:hypothetical protein T02_16271 [Trichinella nativa]
MRLTAEQTRTNSGEQLLVYHSPTNDVLIFAIDAGVRHQLPPVSNSTKERTDLIIKLLTVCNLAERVLPSSEQSSSPIRPSCAWLQGVFSSMIKTTSPTADCSCNFRHFSREESVTMYSCFQGYLSIFDAAGSGRGCFLALVFHRSPCQVATTVLEKSLTPTGGRSSRLQGRRALATLLRFLDLVVPSCGDVVTLVSRSLTRRRCRKTSP